ncbi:DNA ligase 4 [Daldinia childiae]|uniref:DNA ligase 4 n=1 Tax=Daldinia childiae TaxID=326645 RepID=UPI00144632CF|nr:DNA ligase 4 [Daldinia childiae]KAF3068932.1 DNA ligase 4 [Daldinia childiae]
MPFPYKYICDLLQQLDNESRKDGHKQTSARSIIETWFREHRSSLDASENDPSAILSTLLPRRRTDKIYLIQAARLESIFGKALLLGASRLQELRRYRTPGLGVDLADCVEGILKRTPNDTQDCNGLTVEEIDDTLNRIAAACRFSSPSVRASRRTQDSRDQDQSLVTIYRKLSPRDAKWFTRLILKNYQPVVIDERLVFRCYNDLLPQLMKVRDDFTTATTFLRQVSQPSRDQPDIASMLKPVIGTKVGRQTWLKGRSIKHCLDMGKSRDMSCEQKIDGEYCQIHIDLRKRCSPIQIFSKSGKDSTQDRIGLQQVIRDSLKLGTSDCPFKVGCILEGEMVVYSTQDNKILPFHKIRKHVSRSGSFIGTSYDSQPHDYEHLMIVYFDVLLIDDESLLGVRQFERFRRLSDLVTCRKGCAELVPRETISFGRPSAALRLREAFAKCIVARGEGLVLKPDEPYFNFSTAQKSFSCCNIKLKKEYVQGWGDVGDLSVIGASYDAAKVKEYKKPNIKWTHFFIGCLDNKEKARARTEKPRFIVTNVVELSEALLWTVMTQCFPSPVPFDSNESIILDFKLGRVDKRPDDIFLEPLVFDMRCFSFDKSPNTTFWSMRFPSVSKIHHDRSYLDTISFTELQELASNATEIPELEDSQEMRKWISALEKADPGGIAVDVISQQSNRTEPRAPPRPSPNETNHEKEPRSVLMPKSCKRMWSQEPTPSFAYKWDVSLGKTRKSRVRKICLVESRRVDATSSFVKNIGEAGLKKKNGEREWVGVYDWRILEDISDLESGKTKLEGIDLWRKHYVAIA